MPKLKVLTIVFEGKILPHEIPAFRGAMAHKAGLEHSLFHNHQKAGYHYRYPLIQYKLIDRKPALICIGEGMEEVHHFFTNRDWSLRISGRTLPMKIHRLDMTQCDLRVTEQPITYSIHQWIALNQKSHPQYMALSGLKDRIEFLERKLVGNILSMAKGIGWRVQERFNLDIIDLPAPRSVKVKGVNIMGFAPRFRANIWLPDHLGLGKNVSLGFGAVRKMRNHTQRPSLSMPHSAPAIHHLD